MTLRHLSLLVYVWELGALSVSLVPPCFNKDDLLNLVKVDVEVFLGHLVWGLLLCFVLLALDTDSLIFCPLASFLVERLIFVELE